MPTLPVRKFAISVDPDEVVDFAEELPYFERMFSALGFEKVSAYKYRYGDRECTITTELKSSTDGFELWATVQAADKHEYRLEEIASAFSASIVAGPVTGNHTRQSTAYFTRSDIF